MIIIRNFNLQSECILQIGELITKLDESFLKQHSDVPWRQIKGMRNVYAHDYDTIDLNTVWEAITEDVPELRSKLENILAQEYFHE